MIAVTDIDDNRLSRAACLFPPEHAEKEGIQLVYVNTGKSGEPAKQLRRLTGGKGFDDVFIFAPVKQVIEQGDDILGFDGCLNFCRPTNPESGQNSTYNVHYAYSHCGNVRGIQ
jgi:threonine dehydrogenase-like Zn-dependent dehydrogenase